MPSLWVFKINLLISELKIIFNLKKLRHKELTVKMFLLLTLYDLTILAQHLKIIICK